MKTLAYGLSIICVIVAIMYFVLPGGSLPTFLPGYQDSFISPPHINVTWFSWFSALTEIGTGTAFAIAGIRARRSVDEASVVRLRPRQGVAR